MWQIKAVRAEETNQFLKKRRGDGWKPFGVTAVSVSKGCEQYRTEAMVWLRREIPDKEVLRQALGMEVSDAIIS